MIRAEETDRFEPAEWNRLLERCGGNALHLPAVHIADQPKGSFRHLVFREKEEPVACAIGFSIARNLMGFDIGRRTLFLPTPPAVSRERQDCLEAVYASLINYAGQQGYRQLVVQPAFGHSVEDLRSLEPYVTSCVVEFVVDLSHDLQTILAAMHRFHRKNIRRAERSPLRISVDNSLGALLRLREMQITSAKRASGRGGTFMVRGEDYFRRIHRDIYEPGIGELLLAFIDGEAVAGLATITTATRGMTVRSGSTSRGYEFQAMYLLQYHVLLRAKEKGLQEINLGGVPEAARNESHPQHGLYEFKKGFGGGEFVRAGLSVSLR